VNMLRRGQVVVRGGDLTPAEQFYSLAA
jgi:hypothetical protein